MTSLFLSAIFALTFFATPLMALADAPPSLQEFQQAAQFQQFIQSPFWRKDKARNFYLFHTKLVRDGIDSTKAIYIKGIEPLRGNI
jgi:hypothetical protein